MFLRLSLVGLVALAMFACASTTEQGKGVMSQQKMPACLDSGTQCRADGDCCSLWCVNGACERREP
jgi:hypothetical protein